MAAIKQKDILFFTKHLALAIKTGLTLVEGLQMLHRQAKGKMREVLTGILNVVKTGHPFHKALAQYKDHFSSIYINLIKTGEESGTLSENLEHLAENLRKSYELKKKIQSAMIYPVLIVVAVLGVGTAVAVFILPQVVPLLLTLDVKLPLSTRIVIGISDFVQNHTLILIFGFLAFIFAIIVFLKVKTLRHLLDRAVLHTPVFGAIIRNVNVAQFTHILGTLLRSGLTLDRSLKITHDALENWAYKTAIKKLMPEVEKGKMLSVTLMPHASLFPSLLSDMIAMGEKTGSLDDALTYLSDFYEKEVDSVVKNISNIIEPVLLLIIGSMVGLVAVSIFGPIYSLTGSL